MGDHIEYGTTGKPHPYHLVRPSIWPLVASIVAGLTAFGMVLFMHDTKLGDLFKSLQGAEGGIGDFKFGAKLLIPAFLGILAVMFFWWKDIIFETVKENVHNGITEVGLKFGMSLFIASEVMFFVAFFWAFFDASLFPGEPHQYLRLEYTGGTWPPPQFETINAFDLPFMMTLILLLSGCTVTWAHHAILEGKNKDAIIGLGLSALLGFAFLGFAMFEYHHAEFKFKDGVFPTTFYMATGFHCFHVFVGAVFLIVCWIRAKKGHFTPKRHFGFEAAAWYWHFVDVVWLFLFIAIYWWGSVGAGTAAH
ncbi:MAG: cytochrome c oxidase subunit 3 [Micavibrio aeruginosavorus]|uniref:cytochrome-c oxidase n=1 Tax=Micavibrio aeruginosavorus TaxID=349221 RepID=A0A2W5N4B8_9BACT|nr:MAG: cytochrome c oxidase subunit 3 [Micavibrio aeruginosavorus]